MHEEVQDRANPLLANVQTETKFQDQQEPAYAEITPYTMKAGHKPYNPVKQTVHLEDHTTGMKDTRQPKETLTTSNTTIAPPPSPDGAYMSLCVTGKEQESQYTVIRNASKTTTQPPRSTLTAPPPSNMSSGGVYMTLSVSTREEGSQYMPLCEATTARQSQGAQSEVKPKHRMA